MNTAKPTAKMKMRQAPSLPHFKPTVYLNVRIFPTQIEQWVQPMRLASAAFF